MRRLSMPVTSSGWFRDYFPESNPMEILRFVFGALLVLMPAVVQAQFDFVTNNGTITITGYTGSGGNVVIPDETNGLPVASIGGGAFYKATNLTKVEIPDSVTAIGGYAFGYCYYLTQVSMGTNITIIENNAFDTCQSLTSITIPDSVTTLGMEAFFYCTSLTSVAIPNSLQTIGTNQFEDCWSLTSVTIPDTITNIADSAFANDFSLTNLTIPSSVTHIGELAFGIDAYQIPRKLYFEGNAPTIINYRTFYGNTRTTVYYLPGTTGWGTNFGGCTTAVWQPQIGASGVQSNQFGFNINWASGQTFVVEATTTLANPSWSPVATNTLSGGTAYFSDPNWANYPSRFYRVRSP